jgi:hypothetical protein
VQLRPGAETSAVQDREADRHGDALFDADECDRDQGDHGQSELEPIKPRDREEIAAMEDPRCDEQEHPGQGRKWHILEHPSRRYKQSYRCCGAETGRLRPA